MNRRNMESFFLSLGDFALYLIIRINLPLVFHSADRIHFQWYDIFILVLICAFRFAFRRFSARLNKTEIGFIVLFSIVFVFGNSYDVTDSSALVTGSVVLVVLAIIEVGLLLSFIISVCGFLKWAILSVNQKENVKKLESFRLYRLFQDHPFRVSLFGILIAWLPYLLIHYPAGIEWDAYHQIMEIMGDLELSRHWPVASSAFFGYGVQLGSLIFGSNNAGIFFVAVIQSITCAACLAYSIYVLKEINISCVWRLVIVAIYALIPLFPRYLTAIVKDALFSAFVVAFVATLTWIMHQVSKGSQVTGRQRTLFGLFGFLMCCFRNNGIIIVVFCLIISGILAILPKGRAYKGIPLILCVVCLGFVGYGKVLDMLAIPKGSIGEAFSIPFQQTARYEVNYDDEVTSEEKEYINRVLDYEKIKTSYNAKLSDGVKSTLRTQSICEIGTYLAKAWFPQFLKHPGVYFEATFNNIEGFFYPFAQQTPYHFYEYATEMGSPEYFEDFGALKPFKRGLKALVFFAEDYFPPTFVLSDCAVQMWFAMLLIVYAYKWGKWKGLIAVPSLVGVLVCIAGPTFWNNGMRYALPVIYANIFLCSVICTWKKREEEAL